MNTTSPDSTPCPQTRDRSSLNTTTAGTLGYPNLITVEEIAATEMALAEWTGATGCKVRFERDELAPDGDIINIGTGDLAALGYPSAPGGVLGLGGGYLQ